MDRETAILTRKLEQDPNLEVFGCRWRGCRAMSLAPMVEDLCPHHLLVAWRRGQFKGGEHARRGTS